MHTCQSGILLSQLPSTGKGRIMFGHLPIGHLSVSLLLVCVGSFLAPPASAAILFSDNFNAGASSAWGSERGTWRDTGGVYDATFPDNTPLTYSGVTTLSGLTDFALDVDVIDLNDGGIWLRSSFNGGAINGVLLVTGGGSGANNGLYWHVVQNGSVAPLQNNQTQAGLQGSDVHLLIEVIGNVYSVYLNGGATPFTTLTTSTFASGSVGLYDFSPVSGATSPRGQTFDNFQVTDLTPVPEPSSFALLGIGAITLAAWRLLRRDPKCRD